MMSLQSLYRNNLSLLTDLYQLTMAYSYWKQGMADQQAAFHLSFRSCPFGGQYAVAAGLAYVADWLQGFRFEDDEPSYLSTLKGNDNRRLFDDGFLDYLRGWEFRCDVDAAPEGTAVFAHEPLVRVVGPLAQAQIIETGLLNMVNFQTLCATKAARVCRSAGEDGVLEFGLRRAQSIDGGLSASRAAYIGGCAATSNVLAGRMFGIPVRGTHAHSWVMSFDSEPEAFAAYGEAMPNNAVFLVDTYDTIRGVERAIEVGRQLRASGYEMVGIRLDSGDLRQLSIDARRMLDAAGFPAAAIVASNDLDEHLIAELKSAGAQINVWGVGTKLATAYDQPALGGVYKLSAIRADESHQWRFKVKLSEQAIKVSTPGVLQIRRFDNGEVFVGDMIYDETLGCPREGRFVRTDNAAEYTYSSSAAFEDLLTPVFRSGVLQNEPPSAALARERAQSQLARLPATVTRLNGPSAYEVGLERSLYERRAELIAAARSEGVQS